MGERGRTSTAALAVVGPSGIETVRRPTAPDDLSDEQAEEWRAVVSRMPADWFPRETHGCLSQYCRHVVTARRISQLVASCEETDPLDVNYYDQLLKMQEREGRALSSLATRLRLTPQTNYDKTKKRTVRAAKAPWET